MRLHNAVCAWLEAHAAQMRRDEPTESREVQLDALVETAHSYTSPPELHAGHRGQSLDDDDGGVYKHGRIGFQRR